MKAIQSQQLLEETDMDLSTLKQVLESECKVPSMRPFEGSNYLECPWLSWAIQATPQPVDKTKGLLLMQDWDSKTQSLAQAVDHINKYLKILKREDKTLQNLLRKPGWKTAIENRSWLVSNAAWGLRQLNKEGSEAKMCGYLGAAIHKASFLTWGRLVVELSEGQTCFQLVVAGKWAEFEDFPSNSNYSMSLKSYLEKWMKWVSNNTNAVTVPDDLKQKIVKVDGHVHYVRHPSTWGFNNKRGYTEKIEDAPPGSDLLHS